MLTPQTPDQSWLNSYLGDSLREAKGFAIHTPEVSIKLDQNENPTDWPPAIKQKVMEELAQTSWNRYPSAYSDDLNALVATYAGVPSECCLLGTGSNYLLTVLINTFCRHREGDLMIARPSFALYESHCRYEGIPYTPSTLTDDLEYDLQQLSDLRPGSIVLFSSPNNPPGNGLKYDELKQLLTDHPKSLFFADEAYFEYVERPFTPLLAEHSNLLIIRTFSKTMSLAGLRAGYILAHESYIKELKKLRLPFMMNHFAIAALRVVLTDEGCKAHLAETVATAKRERERVYRELHGMSSAKGFSIKPSEANFLLARWPSNEAKLAAYEGLINAGILVRDVSAGPGLAGSLRITIGTPEENSALLRAMSEI